jgi:hypothetical protein
LHGVERAGGAPHAAQPGDGGEGGKIAGVHGIKFNDADNRYKSLFTMTSEAYGCRETRSLP